MSDNRFYDGQEIQSIFHLDDEITNVNDMTIKRITVVMENGQMAGVPWFQVEYVNGVKRKFNGAHVEGVDVYQEHRVAASKPNKWKD